MSQNTNRLTRFFLVLLTFVTLLFPTLSTPAYSQVPTTNSTNPATGTGSQTTFAFTFQLLQAADMTVYVSGTLQTQGTAYTVTPAGGSYPCTGGNVVFISGHIPASSAPIVMARQLTLTQTTSFPVEGDLPSSTLQNVVDRTVMQVQQLNTQLGLAVTLPITDVGTVTTALPSPVAGDLIAWNSAANALINITPLSVFQQYVSPSLLSTTGSPVNGNLAIFSGPNTITNGNLSGDITTSGSNATTLATVNSNVGSFTSANITVNAKGLITAAANGSGGGGAPSNLVTSANPNSNNAGTQGQFCYDSTHAVNYICTTTGSSSSAVWTRLTEPVGTIKWWWSTAAPPTGYHVCDGTNGTPNMIGMFPQGSNLTGGSTAGNTNGFDTSGSVTNQSVVGTISQTCTVGGGAFSEGLPNSTIDSGTVGGSAAASSTHTHAISGTATSSSFSIQPSALAAPWIMRIN